VFQFVITIAIAAFVLIPASQINVVGILNNVKALYPSDVELQIQDGKLAINQPLPYRVSIPAIMDEQMRPTRWNPQGSEIKYLLVFDSDENIKGAADVYAAAAFAVVTESTIYTREGEGDGLRVNSIPAEESVTLNRGVVDQAFDTITTSTFVQQKLYVPLLAGIFLFIVLPAILLGSLVTVAVYGFFVWLMAKVLKSWMMAGQTLTYSKAVQVSIHSLTLINVLHFVLRWIGEGKILDGGTFLLAFLVWTGFVLYQSLHMKDGVKATSRKATKIPLKASSKSQAAFQKPVKSKK